MATKRLRNEQRDAPKDMEWMVNQREDVDATLEEAGEQAKDAGVNVETFARQGDPADAILDVAEEQGSDLIIVGNKGMTGRQALPARLGAQQGLPPRAVVGPDHQDDLGGGAGRASADRARAVAAAPLTSP